MNKKLILICLSTLFSFLIAESVLRIFKLVPIVDQSNAKEIYQHYGNSYRLKKNLKNVSFAGFEVSSNKYGYRDKGMVKENVNDQTIAIVGDSWSFGWGLKESESLANNLAKRLNVNVFNFSIPGHNIQDHRLTFLNIKSQFRVEKVIFLIHLNDILNLNERKKFKEFQGKKKSLVVELIKRNLLLPLAERFNIANYSSVAKFKELYKTESQDYQIYKNELRKIKKISMEENIDISFYLLPIPFSDSTEYQLLSTHNQILEDLRELNLKGYDLSGAYKGIKKSRLVLSSYDAHPNSFAINKLVNEMLQTLAK